MKVPKLIHFPIALFNKIEGYRKNNGLNFTNAVLELIRKGLGEL